MNISNIRSSNWAQTRVGRFVRKLIFDSFRDFLKAGVLVAIFFVWGNFLGLLKPPSNPLSMPLNQIGDYFEGYAFLSPAFDRARDDFDGDYVLRFDPPRLEQLRVCKDLSDNDPPEGTALLEHIAAQLNRCIAVNYQRQGALNIVTIAKATKPLGLASVSRDGDEHLFCECSPKVRSAFRSDARNP